MSTVVSLFTGAGGFDWGFHREDFEVIWANDNNKDACNTYKLNYSLKPLCLDLNEVDLSVIPKADILIGGPPCQGFSLAGKRDPSDPRSALVWKYFEVLKHVNPRIFIMENVMDIKSAKDSNGRKVLDMLMAKFTSMGYTVNIWELNAADYGVPQLRRRIFIVGTSDGTVLHRPDPTTKNYVGSKEALGDLGEPTEDGISEYIKGITNKFQIFVAHPNTLVSDKFNHHYIHVATPGERKMIPFIKPGGNWKDIPDSVSTGRVMNIKKDGGRTTTYMRLHPDKPSYTINANFHNMNVGSNVHYEFNRLITIREGMRLQSFPDSFQLDCPTKYGKYALVGNAVPPLLSWEIAKRVKEYMKGEYIMARKVKGGF